MGRALGVAGGPYRKLGPTGCKGIQLARDRPEGRSTIRDRATASGRSGPAGGPSQGCSPAGLRCPSHGTSIPRGQVGGTNQIRYGGSRRRERYPRPQARRRQGSFSRTSALQATASLKPAGALRSLVEEERAGLGGRCPPCLPQARLGALALLRRSRCVPGRASSGRAARPGGGQTLPVGRARRRACTCGGRGGARAGH